MGRLMGEFVRERVSKCSYKTQSLLQIVLLIIQIVLLIIQNVPEMRACIFPMLI